ncbi:MAG TPA: RNA polymerase sigma factor [Pyrinomonadaceae bacterium]
MRIRELAKVPGGVRNMSLAIGIPLPVNALAQNQTIFNQLIKRAAAGDIAAFEQIMIHSQQRVMAMAWRMLGNEADARDASQEVFLRVYKHLGGFRQNEDFFAWLYTITVNVCRDVSKKRQRHHDQFTSLEGSTGEAAFAVASEQVNAEDAFVITQQRELIAKAMATLPDKERASIVLRDVEGLATDEVARIMKSSSTTVRSQISSARKKIKIYCEQYLKRNERGESHEL